ncbi:hypothetical protein PR202_ga08994 [Eleusine coracana subsp. coracana]|uniref:Uncharacterized protein n=1 Tax=Eleusine coracana subsp. coracana TaxID=191504 RepID=A0AAV5C435_ELECO|nr:hypothetical protein QOZ80_1AG0040380 [Eleusine coracana subsp. coracana]GJM92517.1 hypothetical protein PR202_ga08994 [Eleusine coracana subsp. coracana]
MAAGSSVPIDDMQAPPLMADWMPMRYLGSFYHGGLDARFQNGEAPASMYAAADQLPVDMNSLVARIGMTPAGFEMPDGAFAATGFGAVGGVPAEVAMARQQLVGGDGGRPQAPLKASWTEEEDSILRNMVVQHGERKWSVIAQCLPGRIGKQCRERWINHLRPDIKQNDIWTEEEDNKLISAHKRMGNRWSSIAEYLPGRSENAVKNHWNATLRSLKAKRRLKKKKSEQAPPGQYSVLENYIRSQYKEDGMPAAPPPPHHLAFSDLLIPAVHDAPAASSPIATTTGIIFTGNSSAAGSPNPGMINLNMPPQLPDLDLNLNTISDLQEYRLNPTYAMSVSAPAPQLQPAPQDTRQICSSLDLFPFDGYIRLLSSDHGSYHEASSSSNPAASGYYKW